MAFNRGDTVQHKEFGVGEVGQVFGDTYWVQFNGEQGYRTVEYGELTSRPDLRESDEGRRWCRPPVGVHKPYRDKKS